MCFASLRAMIEGLYNREAYQLAQVLLDKSLMQHQVTAANIANVETAGYKRVQLDPRFEVQLKQALNGDDLKSLDSLKPTIVKDEETASVRPDGNNVSLEKELLAMNRNALEYEFLTKYVGKSFGRIKMGITGNTARG